MRKIAEPPLSEGDIVSCKTYYSDKCRMMEGAIRWRGGKYVVDGYIQVSNFPPTFTDAIIPVSSCWGFKIKRTQIKEVNHER